MQTKDSLEGLYLPADLERPKEMRELARERSTWTVLQTEHQNDFFYILKEGVMRDTRDTRYIYRL